MSGADARVTAQRLEQGFDLAANGCTCTELIQFVLKIAKPSSLIHWTNLWLACMGVILENGLPMLKGHSRKSFSEATGSSIAMIPVIDSGVTADVIASNTHLFELPEALQYALLETDHSQDVDSNIQKLREMENEAAAGNYEVLCFFGNCYLSAGRKQDAEKVYLYLKE